MDTDNDLSVTLPIKPCPSNKCRKRIRRESKRQKLKKMRHTPKGLPEFPTCGHKGQPGRPYYCSSLTMRQIKLFHQQLFASNEKIKQDSFLIACCEGKKCKRSKAVKDKISIKYFITTSHGHKIRVCKTAFLKITGLSRDRIERVMKNYVLYGNMPQEKRGGNRIGDKNDGKKTSIKNFIESLKCVESHYCRSQTSSRVYLPCQLNFTKLWQIYNSSVGDELRVKLGYFRTYVNTHYNIGFGTPKSDVCSTCIRSNEQLIKNKNLSSVEKQNLITEQRIHKLKAKAFFALLKRSSENIAIFSFDCEKNLPLPKLPDQACYFSQQINYYNFTVVHGPSTAKLSPDNVFSYVWPESEFPKNSNSIASAVWDVLCKFHFFETTDVVYLFADGCGGQNKNSIMMTMISFWLQTKAPQHIKSVSLIFPMVGHSFIPLDRVFGMVERKVKKKSVIIKPADYDEIIACNSTLRKLGVDWNIQDWKSAAQINTKAPGSWHFQFNKAKRFVFTKGKTNCLIRGESNYNVDVGKPKSVSKRGKKTTCINPMILSTGSYLKGDKSTIISLLKKHYGDAWEENPDLQFFVTNLIHVNNAERNTDNDQDADVEAGCSNLRSCEIDLPV